MGLALAVEVVERVLVVSGVPSAFGCSLGFGELPGAPLPECLLALGPQQLVLRRGSRNGSFRKLGATLFWGPYNKDPTIKGTLC